jgi:hypothetical protein
MSYITLYMDQPASSGSVNKKDDHEKEEDLAEDREATASRDEVKTSAETGMTRLAAVLPAKLRPNINLRV